uniref:Uncharacterized protein n=1 Tax=Arundo donax TaxID=35708 RepID=A0A0A8Y8Z6_ARUDO
MQIYSRAAYFRYYNLPPPPSISNAITLI